jgi:hypothetical protein
MLLYLVQEVTNLQTFYAGVGVNIFNTNRKYFSNLMAIMSQILLIFMPVANRHKLNQNTIFIPSTNLYL